MKIVSTKYEPMRGFTLIEIVVALAIVAIAVLAIASAMNHHVIAATGLEQRVTASFVATNQIAELRHDAKISRVKAGRSSDLVKMGGREWRVITLIKKTDVERVFLLTVTVSDRAVRDEAPFASLTTAISDVL